MHASFQRLIYYHDILLNLGMTGLLKTVSRDARGLHNAEANRQSIATKQTSDERVTPNRELAGKFPYEKLGNETLHFA